MKKYNELMRFAKNCVITLEYLLKNKFALRNHFSIITIDNKSFDFKRAGYSVKVSEQYSQYRDFSIYENTRTDYLSYIKSGTSIIYSTKNATNKTLDLIDDLSLESYFQNSLIYNDNELKAIFLASYFKKHGNFGTCIFEMSSMKNFIKNVKVLINAGY